MIISENSQLENREFNELLKRTVESLTVLSTKNASSISKLTGQKFEPYVKDLMEDLSKGTSFEGSIQLIGGQKFPDIIAKKFFGVEVKTTTQNHWKTTGNSVLESSRVEDVERIHMLFAKLAPPIEFKSRPYEECLSEVVVTHSPRYLIDMNLKAGHTIFDKINTTYDSLRKSNDPIKPIIEYYKNKLKPGESLWWINDENPKPANLIIKFWNNLTTSEKNQLRFKAMVLFPEIFGNKADKFSRIALWLISSEGIICPNVRDQFTAGGKESIEYGGEVFENIPRIVGNLIRNKDEIKNVILNTSNEELNEFWKIDTNEKNKLIEWIEMVDSETKSILKMTKLDLKKLLITSF